MLLRPSRNLLTCDNHLFKILSYMQKDIQGISYLLLAILWTLVSAQALLRFSNRLRSWDWKNILSGSSKTLGDMWNKGKLIVDGWGGPSPSKFSFRSLADVIPFVTCQAPSFAGECLVFRGGLTRLWVCHLYRNGRDYDNLELEVVRWLGHMNEMWGVNASR